MAEFKVIALAGSSLCLIVQPSSVPSATQWYPAWRKKKKQNHFWFKNTARTACKSLCYITAVIVHLQCCTCFSGWYSGSHTQFPHFISQNWGKLFSGYVGWRWESMDRTGVHFYWTHFFHLRNNLVIHNDSNLVASLSQGPPLFTDHLVKNCILHISTQMNPDRQRTLHV